MALLPDAFHVEREDELALTLSDLSRPSWACVTVGRGVGRSVRVFFEDYEHLTSFAQGMLALPKPKEASDGRTEV